MDKTIDEIYQEMLDVFRACSGYLPHSACDLAARLYAAAAQIRGLYLQTRWTLDQCFPQTAQGEYLDRHAGTRDLARGVARCAEGVVRFGIPAAVGEALDIPAGTVCMTADGVRFATTEDARIAAGDLTADVPARAVEAGTDGNVPAGAVCVMAALPVGVRSCVNPAAFSGGEDQESDEELRARLLDSYKRLPNGANAAYYEQTALSCPGVAAAVAVGKPRGTGSVDLYVAAAGGIPGEETLAAVDALLQERREIAVDLKVLAPSAETVDVAAAVAPAGGCTLAEAQAQAEAALREMFTGSLLGRGITLARLGALLYGLPAVDNYRITAPAQDVAARATVLPCLGTVTITELEA